YLARVDNRLSPAGQLAAGEPAELRARAAVVNAASASPIRHAARSRGPTGLEIVRSSANGTPAPAAAHATPYPSIASARASGCRSARWRARSAVPVTVLTVSTAPVSACGSAARNHATRVGSAVATVAPKPSSSRGRKPVGDSAPRSAATLAVATTVAPTGARPGNPPPIPALITAVYG